MYKSIKYNIPTWLATYSYFIIIYQLLLLSDYDYY